MESKSNAGNTFHRFIDEIGVPSEILTDGAQELLFSYFGQLCQKYRIRQTRTEPYSPWQNPAELAGGTIKRKVRRLMKVTGTPVRLWDYCWDYVCLIRNYTFTDNVHLDGMTPY